MDLKMIKFTEDRAEMLQIGREVVEKNPQKYNEKMLAMIEKDVRAKVPHASEDELKDYMLLTIYHYWAYGSTYDEYFYYDFEHKTHEEKLTYMTFRFRLLYMEHMNKKEDAHLLFNKYETYTLAHLLFNKYETYTLFREQYMRDVIRCRTEEDYPVFKAFTDKHKEFVVKPTDMSGGRGVYKTDVIGLSEDELRQKYMKLLQEGTDNLSKYQRGKEGSVVIEELIEQDEALAAFHPASINGIRVPTIRVNGEIIVYEPWFKIGRGGNFLTSAVFGTLDAGINAETGVIDTPGMNEDGEVFTNHPDNGMQIVGFQIPKWDELVALAKKCAAKLPDFNYIGWDFVLSKKGWCVMEANYSGDFMWQLYRGRGMKKEFEELIGWKCDKQFWWQ